MTLAFNSAKRGNLVAIVATLSLDPDWQIRQEAFHAMARMVARHGPLLSWDVISEGFELSGERILFATKAKGIFRPKQMREGALSIKTIVPRGGRESPYDDREYEGFFLYQLEGEDSGSRANRELRRAEELNAPLLYLRGIEPGLYKPIWPVFIKVDVTTMSCRVLVDDKEFVATGLAVADHMANEIRRQYLTVQTKRRLHQDQFRIRVLRAYESRCAVCRLPRQELLDAAHILPDRDERGVPEVPNGVALCRLHHSAFDADLMGIRPDGVIELSRALRDTRDGPTLEHALHAFHEEPLILPRRLEDRPKREFLEERYERFLKAV